MADVFTREQAGRMFGFIAAGASTGGLLGPLVAGRLADLPSCDELINSIVREARERLAALGLVPLASGIVRAYHQQQCQ